MYDKPFLLDLLDGRASSKRSLQPFAKLIITQGSSYFFSLLGSQILTQVNLKTLRYNQYQILGT